MVEKVITWIAWAIQKVWPGLVLALVLKLISHTEFYGKYLSRPFSMIKRHLFGPRLQIRCLAFQEDGSSHGNFSVLKVEIINQPNMKHLPLFNWQLPDTIRQKINSVIPCGPLESGRVYRRFFNNQWELIAEPQRNVFQRRYGERWGDKHVELTLKGKVAIDIVGISTRGDCYGLVTRIGERWFLRGGPDDSQIDLPLIAGNEYYLEVSVGDDESGIIYLVSYFVLGHQGTIHSFKILPTIPPTGITKVKYGYDERA
jgi:hypothetical protein